MIWGAGFHGWLGPISPLVVFFLGWPSVSLHYKKYSYHDMIFTTCGHSPSSPYPCHLRIYVDLPDAVNRLKILKIILAQEKIESEFSFDHLANVTDGYSGSDLKNLCVAAAYRPVQ